MFNLLTKFHTPTSGRIFFNGKDITNWKPAEIANHGIVRSFQISAVFPHLTHAGKRPPRAAAQARRQLPVLALEERAAQPR